MSSTHKVTNPYKPYKKNNDDAPPVEAPKGTQDFTRHDTMSDVTRGARYPNTGYLGIPRPPVFTNTTVFAKKKSRTNTSTPGTLINVRGNVPWTSNHIHAYDTAIQDTSWIYRVAEKLVCPPLRNRLWCLFWTNAPTISSLPQEIALQNKIRPYKRYYSLRTDLAETDPQNEWENENIEIHFPRLLLMTDPHGNDQSILVASPSEKASALWTSFVAPTTVI